MKLTHGQLLKFSLDPDTRWRLVFSPNLNANVYFSTVVWMN